MNASVINLSEFREKKNLDGERKAGVATTFGAAIQAQADLQNVGTDEELVTRIERIKSSIGRINELMAELKSLSHRKS